jgi:phospholipase/carboxylesterase
MNNTLEYIERYSNPSIKPQAVVIWLHGLGASYDDFVPVVPELQLAYSVKFVFPNAPMRPITINNGYVMRAWYDIRDLGGTVSHFIDEAGINQSVKQIEELIAQQIKQGFAPEQIIIAGFSQGGVISYITGINTKYKLGGVLALSCYLPKSVAKLDKGVNKTTPIFACHGKQDMVVPYTAGLHAYNELAQHGYNIKWAEYPMEHSVCIEELQNIGQWINSCLAN